MMSIHSEASHIEFLFFARLYPTRFQLNILRHSKLFHNQGKVGFTVRSIGYVDLCIADLDIHLHDFSDLLKVSHQLDCVLSHGLSSLYRFEFLL